MKQRVVIIAVDGGLRPETLAAVEEQFPAVELAIQGRGERFALADDLRRLWREPGDLVVVEQDNIPPPGSIRRLLECPRGWCGHLGPCGGRLQPMTHQLVKWSESYRRRFPDAADVALGRDVQAERGHCAPTGHSWGWDLHDPRSWPSRVGWITVDSVLARQLQRHGEPWHQHDPPVGHLHDYTARPVNSY